MKETTAPFAQFDYPDERIAPLLDERTRLNDWLERLDDRGRDVPEHIVARVGADYRARLAKLLEELRPHVEALREQLEAFERDLETAEGAYTAARDALEEMRLRHLTGEFGDDVWGERSPSLQKAVDESEAERDQIQAEVLRVRELIAEIDPASVLTVAVAEPGDEVTEPGVPRAQETEAEELIVAGGGAAVQAEDTGEEVTGWVTSSTGEGAAAEAASADGGAPVPAADEVLAEWSPEDADDEENLPWLELLETNGAEATGEMHASDFDAAEFLDRASEGSDLAEGGHRSGQGAAAATADLMEDEDAAFLQELDRALAASPARPVLDAVPQNDTAPRGLQCAGCGVVNDPHSWYCEGCGEELA